MKEAKNDCVVLAIRIAEGMMRSGGETYRAEECCKSVLNAFGAVNASVVALPTALLVSAYVDGVHRTESVSIKHRDVNLKGIAEYNNLSRRISVGELSVNEALLLLKKPKGSGALSAIAFTALAAGFFSFVFNGGVKDFLPTCLISAIATAFKVVADRWGNISFLTVMGSCMIVAALARLTVGIFPACSQEAIIVGGIISMLPGLALTNSLRDTINGDLISGAARMYEALITAIVIAGGVAVVLAM